jgi:hypothetical protein
LPQATQKLGHEVVVVSPQSGINTITGEGLAYDVERGMHHLV